MSTEFAVILVESTSHALKIEKLLVSRQFACKLVPVPRHLSSDCGVCVRILQQDMCEVKDYLAEHQIIPQGIEVL